MLHWPLQFQQASQFLCSPTDVDLLLVEIRSHDLGMLWPTDAVAASNKLAGHRLCLRSSEVRLASSGSNISAVPGLRSQP